MNVFDRNEMTLTGRLIEAPDEATAQDAAARAAWTSLAEPGDGTAFELIAALGAVAAFAALVEGQTAAQLAEQAPDLPTVALAEGLERWRPRIDRQLLRRRLEAAVSLECSLILPGGDDWPEPVDDLGRHAPLALWARGDRAAAATARSIAIVGARASTGYGEHVGAELAAGLAERGVSILSGAAFGIDGVAHRSALALGGKTVAFLAGGPDRLYPSAHAAMLERMMNTADCAVLTELPPGSSPTRWRFLQRNRLIAAISAATIVVEAGARSGSLNTAGHASALGRALGAVPGPVTSSSSAGCHQLLREFDAICITGVDDAVELIDGFGVQQLLPDPERDPLTTRVRDALSTRLSKDTVDIAKATGLGPRDVLAALGNLMAEGRAERTADGGWRSVAER